MILRRLIILALLCLLTACQSTGVTVDNQLELEGAWHIAKIQGSSVVNYSPAQLTFLAGGTLQGNNSCNTFSGQYHFFNNALTLAPKAGTMKACVDELEAQEEKVMRLLPLVSQASIEKNKLLLKNSDDKVLFTLIRIEKTVDDMSVEHQ